ncbi:MAG: PHP domain-containing protein [Anaerolineaceae bacterium]|nr:PHP domain-containing protein [Anaerolineaceae bacterium]
MNNTIKVDFHVHSIASWDSLSRGEALVRRAKKLGLGKLILTDHNTINEAVRLQNKYPDYVIVGEEILTTKAEILAFFVKEEIPKDIEPLEALKRLRDQGAFISLSHPYAPMRFHWTEAEMESFLPWLDAIEIANARCLEEMNHLAMKFAAYHGLQGTAGSDAHGVPELGAMGLELPDFSTAEELRESIKTAKVFGKESPLWVRKYSRMAVFRKALERELGISLLTYYADETRPLFF